MSEPIDQPTSSTPATSALPAEHTPRQRRRLIPSLAWVSGILLIVLTAVAIWALLRPAPAAYTLLRISRQPPWLVFPHGKEGRADQDFETYGKEQVALAKIRPVLNAALRKAEVGSLPLLREQADPIGWLDKHLEVSFDKDSGILRIALRTGPPKARIIIVDAVRDAYLDEVVYKENDAKIKRLTKLKEFYLRNEEDLRNKRQTLRDMAKSLAGPREKFLEAKQKLRDAYLDALQRELITNESDQRKAEVKLVLAERAKKAEDVAHYQAELEYLKEMRKKLESALETQARAAPDIGYTAVDLDFFQKEIDSLESLTKTIAGQKQQLEIELDAPSRIHKLQDAIMEDSRNWQDVLHDLLFWVLP
jgi:hypothetical protein